MSHEAHVDVAHQDAAVETQLAVGLIVLAILLVALGLVVWMISGCSPAFAPGCWLGEWMRWVATVPGKVVAFLALVVACIAAASIIAWLGRVVVALWLRWRRC